jgi:hypothetical protein
MLASPPHVRSSPAPTRLRTETLPLERREVPAVVRTLHTYSERGLVRDQQELQADELWRGGYPRFRANCSSFVHSYSCFRLTPSSGRCYQDSEAREERGVPCPGSTLLRSHGFLLEQVYYILEFVSRGIRLRARAFHPPLGKTGLSSPFSVNRSYSTSTTSPLTAEVYASCSLGTVS